MHDKKFDIKTIDEICLCFFNKLNTHTLLSADTSKTNIYLYVKGLSAGHDPQKIWGIPYQFAFGIPFTSQVYLTSEELFTLLLQLLIRNLTRSSDCDLTLLDFIFPIRYPPAYAVKNEKYKAARIAWNSVVKEFSKGLCPHPESLFPKGSYSGQKLLELIPNFVDEYIYQYQYLLSSDVLEDLFAFRSVFLHNPTYQNVCEEALQKMVGSPQMILSLNEETILTLFMEICAMHVYKYDLKIRGLLTLLFSLRYFDGDNKQKHLWQGIWKEMLQQIQ